jgi:hypothetical protein
LGHGGCPGKTAHAPKVRQPLRARGRSKFLAGGQTVKQIEYTFWQAIIRRRVTHVVACLFVAVIVGLGAFKLTMLAQESSRRAHAEEARQHARAKELDRELTHRAAQRVIESQFWDHVPTVEQVENLADVVAELPVSGTVYVDDTFEHSTEERKIGNRHITVSHIPGRDDRLSILDAIRVAADKQPRLPHMRLPGRLTQPPLDD